MFYFSALLFAHIPPYASSFATNCTIFSIENCATVTMVGTNPMLSNVEVYNLFTSWV